MITLKQQGDDESMYNKQGGDYDNTCELQNVTPVARD